MSRAMKSVIVDDLGALRDRLRAALPQLTIELGELEHTETRDRHVALLIEDPEPRKKDHVYRMTVGVFDGKVHFFVHVHGVSKDTTTQGATHYSKECASLDEVFAIVRSCWTGTAAS
jgi:hypothetical protein